MSNHHESPPPAPVTAADLVHVRRCVELAREAVEDGDEPFDSVLVDEAGVVEAVLGTAGLPVTPLPVSAVAPLVRVAGPAQELEDELRSLQRRVIDRTD